MVAAALFGGRGTDRPVSDGQRGVDYLDYGGWNPPTERAADAAPGAGLCLRLALAVVRPVLALERSLHADTFAQRAGLETAPYSVDELASVTTYFARQAAALSDQVARDSEEHFSEDLADCFEAGPEVYENLAREFPCLDITAVRAKPLVCSRLQSILGFTGVYFPFTGEANVNVDAPACLIPATIAHEMAHQRMVASESEANFVGIAACVTSDNVVFQYSGYLMGLIQLCNALYPVDAQAWQTIVQECFTAELAADWNDNNAYWAALESPVEEVAEQAYDSFLKGNGQELDMRSYGACVDLLVGLLCPAG